MPRERRGLQADRNARGGEPFQYTVSTGTPNR